ncbi:hypothetical protein GQ53DRAFT_758665 [Thozetella sp. PMI_491]|nr:hypothetical protein GQ53DRAFT_758665 [Thozetella sp. PMI_491]
MPMHYTPQERAALLVWINLYKLDNPPRSLDDLKDGLVLGQLLEQILPPSSPFDRSSLNPNPKTEADTRQNLDIIFRALAQFMREDTPERAPSPSQFRAIVENLDGNNICEFVSFIVCAALLGSLVTENAPKITEGHLQGNDSQAIMALIKKIDKREKKPLEGRRSVDREPAREQPSAAYQPGQMVPDSELEIEAALAKSRKEVQDWKEKASIAETRIERLKIHIEELNAELKTLQIKHDSQSTDDPDRLLTIIRGLEAEKREKIAEIDRLEALLEERENKINSIEKKMVTLSASASLVPDLEDSVKELTHQNSELSSQVRVLEKYKAKAQSASEIQRSYQAANARLLEMESELIEKEQLALRYDTTQRTNGELRRTIETLEMQLNDEDLKRAALQDRVNHLERDRETQEQYRGLAEARVKELEELHIGSYSPTRSGSPDAGTTAFNLEEELQTTADPATAAMRLELSKLKAENQLLRNNMGVAADNERLRVDLEIANNKADHLREQCKEANVNHSLAMAQINALLAKMPAERYVEEAPTVLEMFGPLSLLTPEYFRDEAWAQVSNDLRTAKADLEQLKAKLTHLEAEKADKERELQAAKTDRTLLTYLDECSGLADLPGTVTAVGQDSIKALEVLKSSDELISSSLKTELDATRKRLDAMTTHYEQKKDEAYDTLVSERKLRQQLDELNTRLAGGIAAPIPAAPPAADEPAKKKEDEKNEKLKAALKQKIQCAADAPGPMCSSPAILPEHVRPLTRRCAGALMAPQLEKAEQEKYDLLRRLKATENGSAYAAQKAATDQVIKNLQRENAMITTAWYDLTSRLQSNHVVLQRRQDVPKSWLNKQRQMVNATPRR